MRKCPYCAEEIQDEAIICRYCGRDLRVPPPSFQQVIQGQQPASPTRVVTAELKIEAGRTLVVLIGLLGIMAVGGLGLIAMSGSSFRVGVAETLAGILQLIVTVLVGIWAVKDRSRGRSMSGWKKAGFFILAFIPIGSWFALWYASRTLVRARLFGPFATLDVAVTAIGALLVAPVLTSDLSQTTSNQGFGVPTQPEVIRVEPTLWIMTPTPVPVYTPHVQPTAAQVSAPSRMAPGEVSALAKGKTPEVCGKIVDQGTRDCPSCQYGKHSYLSLEGGLSIISYDWLFRTGWVGSCIKVSDTVELRAGRPVFVYGAGEGYAGSKCIINADGTETCNAGDYFQSANGWG